MATPVSSPNPLRRLHDLDKTSPEFPDILTNLLLTEGWINQAQNLPPKGLRELVEYLDEVWVLIAFSRSLLISIEGPRHSRSHPPRFLSLFIRTPKDLWYPQDIANVAHTLPRFFKRERHSGRLWNFGQYTRGDPQWFKSLR